MEYELNLQLKDKGYYNFSKRKRIKFYTSEEQYGGVLEYTLKIYNTHSKLV